jgi:hypothetical protein
MDAVIGKADVKQPSRKLKKEPLSLRSAAGIFLRQLIAVSIAILLISIVLFFLDFTNLNRFDDNGGNRIILEFFKVTPIFLLVGAGVLLASWIVAWILERIYPKYSAIVLAPTNFSGLKREVNAFQRLLNERRQITTDEATLAEKLAVMSEIDERVDRLRRRTTTILTTIGAALLAAAFVVIFAGRLTSVDASAVSNIDRLKSEVLDTTKTLTRLYQYQSLYSQLETARKAFASSSDLEKIERSLGSLREGSNFPPDLQSATQLVSQNNARVEKLNDLLDDAWKRELVAEHGYSDWRYIVATAITRVGVVLIIVFLVQILLGLYRYNMRLIAYYSANRDLLTIWDGNQTTLGQLQAILAPPKIDFGKEPKHPLEDILKVVGEKLDSLKSQKSEP